MKKKINKNKTTDLFKQELILRNIIPALNWKGARMVFPYRWNGETRYAIVEFPKIKWKNKL